MARRRLKGEGSIYQTHGKDCPPAAADGTRPRHTCKGRWMAYLDLGWRDGRDTYAAPQADSPTLDVLTLLAGKLRTGWRLNGVDPAVASVARAAMRG